MKPTWTYAGFGAGRGFPGAIARFFALWEWEKSTIVSVYLWNNGQKNVILHQKSQICSAGTRFFSSLPVFIHGIIFLCFLKYCSL